MALEELQIEVVTPQKILYEETASYVTIPGVMGELGILPGHVPLLTEITSGILSFTSGGSEKKIAIHHGFAQVFKDKITVLGKVAELADDLDISRALEAQQKAEDKLKSISSDTSEDVEVLGAKILRSLTRQQMYKK